MLLNIYDKTHNTQGETMTKDNDKKYCKVCVVNTRHQYGTFKCKDIKGELFQLNVTLNDALKKISDDFVPFAQAEKDNRIDANTPVEYVNTDNGKSNTEELFANSVRALKCLECGHLIKLSRLP